MGDYSVGEVAGVLDVSPDTVRRWVDSGHLPAARDESGHRRVDAVALARFARSLYGEPDPEVTARESARNHLAGIVTRVVKDRVMAHVEVQAGPYRLVSLISRQAADDLELSEGMMVTAVVKATNVSLVRDTD
ncbi:MAG: TOBE domain-containing protein [Actinomycetota bacterium]|nr:TOBE domain-containing protein [Actinomycetota bacterium]